MILSHSNSSSGASGFDADSWDVSPPDSTGLVTPPADAQAEVHSPLCVPTLLVTNLPRILFSQPADLRPLFFPFGEVTHLKIVNDSTGSDQSNISVVVEYKTLAQAQDARDNISGQFYADQPVKAEFLLPAPGAPVDGDRNVWSPAKGDLKTGLNPYAPPFLAQGTPSLDGFKMSFTSGYPGPVLNVSEANGGPSTLPTASSSYVSLPAFRSPVYPNAGLYAPQFGMLRPRSAPSR